PWSFLTNRSRKPGGRGRLPVCVVKILSLLVCIGVPPGFGLALAQSVPCFARRGKRSTQLTVIALQHAMPCGGLPHNHILSISNCLQLSLRGMCSATKCDWR